jgi:hypothetical protein
MTEIQILFQISQVVSNSTNFLSAIQSLSAALERALGGRVLLIGVPEDPSRKVHSIARDAERFLDETAGLPYKSHHTVSLRAGGEELGKLEAFFALDWALDRLHQSMTERIANFAGQQLGMLLERIRLTKERRNLLKQFLEVKEILATRIALQRAEGVLVERWGLDLPVARLWIVGEVVQAGLSPREVANKVLETERLRRETEPACTRGVRANLRTPRGHQEFHMVPSQQTAPAQAAGR